MATLRRRAPVYFRGKVVYQAPEGHCGDYVDTFLADNFAIGALLLTLGLQRYPWGATRSGSCPRFGVLVSRGFRFFLAQCCPAVGTGAPAIEVLSPALVDTVEALVKLWPRERACLGEVAFERRWWRPTRRNVLEMAFLAQPGPGPLTLGLKLAEERPSSSNVSTCASCDSSPLSF